MFDFLSNIRMKEHNNCYTFYIVVRNIFINYCIEVFCYCGYFNSYYYKLSMKKAFVADIELNK